MSSLKSNSKRKKKIQFKANNLNNQIEKTLKSRKTNIKKRVNVFEKIQSTKTHDVKEKD